MVLDRPHGLDARSPRAATRSITCAVHRVAAARAWAPSPAGPGDVIPEPAASPGVTMRSLAACQVCQQHAPSCRRGTERSVV